jgi:hypothetical protein
MTIDALLNILLTVGVPSLMALMGGILAAKALPTDPGTRNLERSLWVCGFLALFLLSIVLSFIQQVRNTTQQRAADGKAAQAELKSTGDIKYMQGELDSINKVLGTLSANSDPKQTAAILKGIMPAIPSGSPRQESNSQKGGSSVDGCYF